MSGEGLRELGGVRSEAGTSRSPLTEETRSARSPEPLTRAEKILVALLAALVGCAAGGFFVMNANFVAINGHLLGLQEQIGDLRTAMQQEIGGLRTDMQREIGDLRTDLSDLSNRITRLEVVMETHHAVPARSDAVRGR